MELYVKYAVKYLYKFLIWILFHSKSKSFNPFNTIIFFQWRLKICCYVFIIINYNIFYDIQKFIFTLFSLLNKYIIMLYMYFYNLSLIKLLINGKRRKWIFWVFFREGGRNFYPRSIRKVRKIVSTSLEIFFRLLDRNHHDTLQYKKSLYMRIFFKNIINFSESWVVFYTLFNGFNSIYEWFFRFFVWVEILPYSFSMCFWINTFIVVILKHYGGFIW